MHTILVVFLTSVFWIYAYIIVDMVKSGREVRKSLAETRESIAKSKQELVEAIERYKTVSAELREASDRFYADVQQPERRAAVANFFGDDRPWLKTVAGDESH